MTQPDPDFIGRMRRVLACTTTRRPVGRVICADESGPLNTAPPLPRLAARRHPARLRATYRRTGGVWHMIAALHLTIGTMTQRIRERKRWRELFAFLKLLRAPAGQPPEALRDRRQLLPARAPPGHRLGRAGNNVELIFLNTYASW